MYTNPPIVAKELMLSSLMILIEYGTSLRAT